MIKRLALISIFFIALIIDIHFHDSGIKQELTVSNLIALFGSWLSLIAFFILVDALKNKYVMTSFGFLVGFLFFFCKRMGFYAGFTIINNNIDYIKSRAGWSQIFDLAADTFFASDVFYSLLLGFLLLATYFFEPEKSQDFFKKKTVLVVSLITLLLSSTGLPYSHDPITNLIRGVYRNFVPRNNFIVEQSKKNVPLPVIEINSHFVGRAKKHIFLIMIESFNDRFVNQKTDDGVEYTPFFNKLTQGHFYAKNYFSNSVYTSKSQFSAVCGQVPMLKKTEFRNASCLRVKCTPEVMKQAGYSTYFVQADPNFDVENTKQFMLARGIENFVEIVKPCKLETDPCYGLGIKDDVFYKRIFNFLKNPEFIKSTKEKPFFMTIATVASHMPFTYLNSNERKFFKNPRNRREHYINFLNLIDEGLKSFFEELEKSEYFDNSIVIVTGDHGFPLGEHGNFHNSSFAYQENFDVPLLIFEKEGTLKSKYSVLEEKAFSHLNLGPTILDLAQYQGQTDFIAPSIFDQSKTNSDLYLIQPFAGGMISVISWPFKYIFSTLRTDEWVYNLQNDYAELHPLTIPKDQLDNLRQKASQTYTQQSIYSCDSGAD